MSDTPVLPAGWRADLALRLDRPPAQPRLPLWWRASAIGSVEPGWVAALHADAPGTTALLQHVVRPAGPGFDIAGEDLTAVLAELAVVMQACGRAHVWRNEQLAVTDAAGTRLATIERAAVRPLGIATHAVHLIGAAAGGGHWVQQRAFDKPTDPGLWDTLMGGMVPAADSLQQALARETWEEAGLRLDSLHDLRLGGRVMSRGPSAEVPGGYVVEAIDWFQAVLPRNAVPVNQDGEVVQFQCVADVQLARMLLADEFTIEAAGVFAAAYSALA